ncbi:uncharacterized protein PGTG_01892 [Puccinia graminis f. sp. tritici CRL 75-36-700-3]|uniref:Uncharacterized protein n=1 Tax=Puccinia graminis f. sp. tritici (strain CRL 75-36-700-3 / race SCCL) TaxID=418459 RepID=E3JTH4_PUCGT|nr:uncharacterized protein PGTG_01892 [Puccinia graminis f. sp. tritici CRL 75-36-700-3]EFP75299.1 hypothetical protein PGTG_01892 [Puccinia graminis f. sp. tritici CRL 75-36-700-3]
MTVEAVAGVVCLGKIAIVQWCVGRLEEKKKKKGGGKKTLGGLGLIFLSLQLNKDIDVIRFKETPQPTFELRASRRCIDRPGTGKSRVERYKKSRKQLVGRVQSAIGVWARKMLDAPEGKWLLNLKTQDPNGFDFESRILFPPYQIQHYRFAYDADVFTRLAYFQRYIWACGRPEDSQFELADVDMPDNA